MNQFLFLHFPELQNLFIYEESKFSCYFLPDMKCFEYYYHLTNSHKFMVWESRHCELFWEFEVFWKIKPQLRKRAALLQKEKQWQN